MKSGTINTLQPTIESIVYHLTYPSYTEVYVVWSTQLWPGRMDIESSSAMLLDSTHDVENFSFAPTFFAIRTQAGQIVGVNSGHKCVDGSYRSRGLWVEPTHRRRGIGKMLLEACISRARVEQCSLVWSLPKKTSAAAYESAGFVQTGDWFKTDTSPANAYFVVQLTINTTTN